VARPNVPTIPDNKIHFYREQLFRELSHLFKWEGLPQTVPQDYIERNLVRHGYVLYYQDENIGNDVLRCEVVGYNRHNQPTTARTFTPTTNNEVNSAITRNIKRLSDSESAKELFDPTADGVLIQNMEYGQSAREIVEHYAERLALAQQAFDTNLLWANIPYIFQVSSDETRLSIEKMFADIFSGKPFTIVDNSLFTDNKDRAGLPSGIPFIGKELIDVQNEIMMKFRESVGFNTAGVDKAERVNTLEIKSNDQHTKSVLQIMLEQRQIACEAINDFFGQSVTVNILADDIDSPHNEEGEEEDDGTGDGGTGGTNPEN
jgi:hypothetical protein